MTTRMSKFLVAATLAVTVSMSCTGRAFVSQQTQNAAKILGANTLGEVNFSKGDVSISTSAKDSLKKAIDEANAKGKIDHVTVLAWSDLEYPSKKAPANSASVSLAGSRLTALEDYLKTQLNVPSVNSYNMAKRPNEFQELLHTSGAKVKDTAETAGAAPRTKEETGFFGQKGQASKAVLMVFLKPTN